MMPSLYYATLLFIDYAIIGYYTLAITLRHYAITPYTYCCRHAAAAITPLAIISLLRHITPLICSSTRHITGFSYILIDYQLIATHITPLHIDVIR